RSSVLPHVPTPGGRRGCRARPVRSHATGALRSARHAAPHGLSAPSGVVARRSLAERRRAAGLPRGGGCDPAPLPETRVGRPSRALALNSFAEGTPARSFELVSTHAMPSGVILSAYKVAG